MRRIAILFLFILVLGVGSAVAGPVTPVAGPWISGSWSERFGITVNCGLDQISVEMKTQGVTFESPVFENFSVAEWFATSIGLTPSTASSSGPLVNTLLFDIKFATPDWNTSSFTFDFFAYNGADIKEWDTVAWNKDDQAWTITVNKGDDCYLVPEPGAPILLLLGFAWAGLAARKRY